MAEDTSGREKLMKRLKKERDKNANARARKDTKPGMGTFSDRVKDAAKKTPEKRGLPAIRKENLPAVQRENLPAIRRENLPAVVSERSKDSSGTNMLRGLAGTAARLGVRGAGPVGALVAMTKPAGEGSDKPSGPLMKGTFGSGDRRAAGKKVSETSVNRAEKGDRPLRKASGTYTRSYENATTSELKGDKGTPPKPKLKPERKAKKEEPKASKRKAEGTKASKQRFKGNWVGAAPTEMQKRAGQKMKNSSLMRYLRSK